MAENRTKTGALTALDSTKRLKELVELAAAPARMRSAELSANAARVKQKNVSAAVAVETARHNASGIFSSAIPLLSSHLRRRHDAAGAASAKADKEWRDIRTLARQALDLIRAAADATAEVGKLEAKLSSGEAVPAAVSERLAILSSRIGFLSGSAGRDIAKAPQLASKAFLLAREAGEIARTWENPAFPSQAQPSEAPVKQNRPIEIGKRGRPAQLGLDFDGTGQVEAEPRIWLPVSAGRTREMVERGARTDRDAPRRGSQLWIPVSERHKVEAFLPLAFRPEGLALSFPPIRPNAVGSNLWGIFDKASWNHIRSGAYDRSGHRCQICGKQYGSLWSRIADAKEKKTHGPVDCHEVWEWDVPDNLPRGTGIQRLRRLLTVCGDCHMIFHDGFALKRAAKAGLASEAADYIRVLRMLVNRTDGPGLDLQLAKDRVAWEANLGIDTWVLDLSHLAAQDMMQDHTPVLQAANRAGITPALIGGIAFRTEDGTYYEKQDAAALAGGASARPSAGGIPARRS
jgi:hypothetical protein